MIDQITFLRYAVYALAALAIVLPLFILIRGQLKFSALRKEKDAYITKLKEQLSLKMDLEAETLGKLKAEREELAKQNEELRIKVQEYRNKPGRDALRQLQITERALGLVHERAPGFGSAWQVSLKEAQAEMEKSEKGLIAFARRALLPGQPAATSYLPNSSNPDSGVIEADNAQRGAVGPA
jgi:hypothetical protein